MRGLCGSCLSQATKSASKALNVSANKQQFQDRTRLIIRPQRALERNRIMHRAREGWSCERGLTHRHSAFPTPNPWLWACGRASAGRVTPIMTLCCQKDVGAGSGSPGTQLYL